MVSCLARSYRNTRSLVQNDVILFLKPMRNQFRGSFCFVIPRFGASNPLAGNRAIDESKVPSLFRLGISTSAPKGLSIGHWRVVLNGATTNGRTTFFYQDAVSLLFFFFFFFTGFIGAEFLFVCFLEWRTSPLCFCYRVLSIIAVFFGKKKRLAPVLFPTLSSFSFSIARFRRKQEEGGGRREEKKKLHKYYSKLFLLFSFIATSVLLMLLLLLLSSGLSLGSRFSFRMNIIISGHKHILLVCHLILLYPFWYHLPNRSPPFIVIILHHVVPGHFTNTHTHTHTQTHADTPDYNKIDFSMNPQCVIIYIYIYV